MRPIQPVHDCFRLSLPSIGARSARLCCLLPGRSFSLRPSPSLSFACITFQKHGANMIVTRPTWKVEVCNSLAPEAELAVDSGGGLGRQVGRLVGVWHVKIGLRGRRGGQRPWRRADDQISACPTSTAADARSRGHEAQSKGSKGTRHAAVSFGTLDTTSRAVSGPWSWRRRTLVSTTIPCRRPRALCPSETSGMRVHSASDTANVPSNKRACCTFHTARGGFGMRDAEPRA